MQSKRNRMTMANEAFQCVHACNFLAMQTDARMHARLGHCFSAWRPQLAWHTQARAAAP